MTTEELFQKIRETRNLYNQFEQFQSIDVPLNSALYEWLDEVEQDLTNNIIPDKIKGIIGHNLDSLKLQDKIRLLSALGSSYINNQYEKDRLGSILQCVQFKETYHLYKAIGYAENNTVIVGANGSGKTTLANSLKQSLDNADGVVIPAQKLLLVPTFDNIPTLKSAMKPFADYQKKVLDDKQTYAAKDQNDFPYDLAREYGSEYRKVLSLLTAERNSNRNEMIDNKEDGSIFYKASFKTTFDTVIDIWNELIPHRTMYLDHDCNLMIKYTPSDSTIEETYEGYKMSDGERIILYLVGRVLKAPQNGLIIVDEPEIFLHRTVVNKLWNILEKARTDCTFIYLTHDLLFATSRIGLKCWVKSYIPPSSWEIQTINENDIPEQLLLELLGSCKQILFCEGKSSTSIDKKIFDVIFPDFIIYPLESCKEVINYTKTFNAIPNTNSKAFGIVDSDYRSDREINDLKANSIYTYHVAEIENLFLVEDFLKAIQEYHNFAGNIEAIKDRIIAKFEKDKNIQCANYVSASIDYYYRKHHIAKGNSKDEVKRRVADFNADICIDEWYDKRMKELELIISKKNYSKIISVYNNKGLHTIVESEFGIRDYHKWALGFLKIAQEDVIKALRKLFPAELMS